MRRMGYTSQTTRRNLMLPQNFLPENYSIQKVADEFSVTAHMVGKPKNSKGKDHSYLTREGKRVDC